MKSLPLLFLLSSAFPAYTQNKPEPQPPSSSPSEARGNSAPAPGANYDEEFIHHAIKCGKVQRRLCEFAGSRVSDIRIKDFANEVMRDHILADRELKTLASSLSVEQKAETADEALGGDHESLKTKSGAEFDKAFLEALAKTHESDIKFYQAAKQHAKADGIKAVVTKTLSVLNRHADRIAALSGNPRRPPAATEPAAPSTPPQQGTRPPGNPGTTPDNIPVPTPKKS